MACRWLVLKGRTPDKAAEIITQEADALDLHDEYGRHRIPGFIPDLRFVYRAGADRFLVFPYFKVRFDFDRDLVSALIAKQTPPPARKRGRGKGTPDARKEWTLGRLRVHFKAGKKRVTAIVINEYQTKYGKITDDRESFRRKIDRWRGDVKKESAAEVAAGKNPDKKAKSS
jgi:hypothetical protein